MWYLILYAVFAAWVLFDGFSRRTGGAAIAWALGTLLLGPIILPIYLAKRPLKNGEIREGGTGWNVLKNFAILWTIVMAVATFSGLSAMSNVTGNLRSDAERAGAGIGIFLGMGVLAAVWFVPTVGAALLGFLLKKNSIVEKGPTGPLVGSDSNAGFANGFAGLVGAAIVGLILIGVSQKNSGSSSTPASTSAKGGGSASQTSLPAADDHEGWHVTEKKSEMDGTREVMLTLDSETEIQGFIGKTRPYIAIQCHQGKPAEVLVKVGKTIQSEYGQCGTYGVRIKFDESTPVRQRWTESTDSVALFSPAPVKLIKQMTTTEIFLFEFTPFQETATTVRFRVSGLTAKLQPVAEVCGLKL